MNESFKKLGTFLGKLFQNLTVLNNTFVETKPTSISVDKIAEEIVEREGGYVNDPSDPGGATKHGVTIGTMKGLRMDLNHDGRVDIYDVKLVTPALAKQIYLEHYYRKPGIDKLPEEIQASVFDMYVNSGSNAIKILQRMVGTNPDGALGPITYAATKKFCELNKNASDLYGIARRNYYYSLADARPASRKYAKRRDGGKGGWIVRAEEFISPALHLTEAQHRARTSRW